MSSQLDLVDNLQAAVVIPGAQAVIAGGLFGVVVGAGAALGDLPNAGTLGALAGAGAAWVTFQGGVMAFRRAVLPEPLPAPALAPARVMAHETIRVELKRENTTQLLNLPVSAAQLAALASGWQAGASLAESTWTGAGGQFTRAEFGRLRNDLIRRGLACWNSPGTPARGWTLTSAGRAAFRYFATLPVDAAA